MLKNPKFQAFFFAFLAAIFNAFVEFLAFFFFKKGFMSSEVAFYKCFVASVILFAILIYMRKLGALLVFIKQKIFHTFASCFFWIFYALSF